MVIRNILLALAAACVAAAIAACSDPQAPPAPTPVAATITDTFEGTLAVGSTNNHPFNVAAIGAVSVTLSDVSPGAALQIGVGMPAGAICNVMSAVTVVPGTTPQLVGTATQTGNFCLSVSDVGNLVEPVQYTVTVFHS